MSFFDLVEKTRTVRRFEQSRPVTMDQLTSLVRLAQMTPSAANLQPLRYMLICEKSTCQDVFECLEWAGYLEDWHQTEGEKPAAYIIMLGDGTNKKPQTDVGIAAQTMMLGACEMGLGCCMLGAIHRDDLRKSLAIDEQYSIELVLALGYPVEEVVMVPMKDGEVRYWRDENGLHHVPKRSLDELIVMKKEEA